MAEQAVVLGQAHCSQDLTAVSLCVQEGSMALVGLSIAAARFIATKENLKGLPGLALV